MVNKIGHYVPVSSGLYIICPYFLIVLRCYLFSAPACLANNRVNSLLF